jgi:hypothetical protein
MHVAASKKAACEYTDPSLRLKNGFAQDDNGLSLIRVDPRKSVAVLLSFST